MGARGAYLLPKYCMYELPLEAGLIATGTTISGAAAETDQWRIVSKEPIDRWLWDVGGDVENTLHDLPDSLIGFAGKPCCEMWRPQ